MRSTMLGIEDYKASVVAVPPLALTRSLEIDPEENSKLINHIQAGGVRILLYGGNANFYHLDLGRFRAAIGALKEATGPQTALIPSIGPDFGKASDQIGALREAGIRDVMILPMAFPADPAGVAEGARRLADALGHGVILYIKRDGYIDPGALERLVAEEAVRFVKYAVEREDPRGDNYLEAILSAVGKDVVASGMGETPILDHFRDYRLATYTSGAVCLAPAAAMALLAACKAGEWDKAERIRKPFLEFERVRAKLGGISVMHDSVALSGVADMGPILPMLSNVASDHRPAVKQAVDGLMAIEAEYRVDA